MIRRLQSSVHQLHAAVGRLQVGQRVLLLAAVVWTFVSVGLPLIQVLVRSLQNSEGAYIGLENYFHYLANPTLTRSFWHSLTVSVLATVLALLLALPYAYALTRSAIPGKRVLLYLGMAPLFAPTMMHAIGLVHLFGRQGLFTKGLFGLLPEVDIHLYGPVGIVLAEVIYLFPQMVLLLMVSFSLTDRRLYEAATSLGAGAIRRFFTITLPNVKYGLTGASLAGFMLSFTDFGAPKVIGGNYGVLAVDIYKQVVGQQNLPMGATIGMLLLFPALLAFIVDQVVQKRQQATVTSNIVPYQPAPDRRRDWPLLIFCTAVGAAIVLLMTTVFLAALVQRWPYDFTLTLDHFSFRTTAGQGFEPLANSVIVATATAVSGAAISFGCAYAIEKFPVWPFLRKITYLVSTLPLGIPGMLIGLAYIFFFNQPEFTIPFTSEAISNPLNGLYGTIYIIILANIIHFYSVPFLTSTAALKQLHHEYEAVGDSLAVARTRTFTAVTVPLSLSAILEIAMFFFVNAMTTISAVIFLYSPDWKLASVAIVSMDDAGDVAAAAAMSALIVVINVAVRLVCELATHLLEKRSERWRTTEAVTAEVT